MTHSILWSKKWSDDLMSWQAFRLLKSFQRKQLTAIRERCFGLLIQICTLGKWVNPWAIKKPVPRRFRSPGAIQRVFRRFFHRLKIQKSQTPWAFSWFQSYYTSITTLLILGATLPQIEDLLKTCSSITSQLSNTTFYPMIIKWSDNLYDSYWW